MSIINSFDDKSKPLVDISAFILERKNCADICIVSFSKHVLDMFLENYKYEIVGFVATANGPIYVYLFEEDNIKMLFYMSPIGSSPASTIMYEVHYAFGPTKFIVYGSCGILDKEKCSGKLIVPFESYRDEGLSYHYMQPSDYIAIKNYKKIANIFDKYKLPYVIGKSWTTDAIYMETMNKANKRRSEGCISVEMESSGLQALSNFYGLDLYTFFFPADLLDGDSWEKANLGGDSERKLQQETFKVAILVAKDIYFL